jgi:hypothetical protein
MADAGPTEQTTGPQGQRNDCGNCIRLCFKRTTGLWTCPLCKGRDFEQLETAYRHVNRSHPGCKARTRALCTAEKALEHRRRVSVHTSRRYLVRKRESPPASSAAAEKPSSNSKAQNFVASSKSPKEKPRYDIYTCTDIIGLVQKKDLLLRCKKRCIQGGKSRR